MGLSLAGAVILGFVAVIIIASLPHGSAGTRLGARSPASGVASPHIRGAKSGNGNGTTATTVKTAGNRSRGRAPAGSSRKTGAGPVGNPLAATSPAVNLAVPAGFGPLLRQVWVGARPGGTPLSAGDVQSTLGGSVFYAEQPSIGTYWAISSFVPSARATSQAGTPAGHALVAAFNKMAVFSRTTGQAWSYVGSAPTGSCPSLVPRPVYTAWGMCGSDATGSSTSTSS